MCDGNLDELMLDNLLAKYVEALNEGKTPDKEDFVAQCPEDSRQELARLMDMVDVLRRNRPISAAEADKKQETKMKVLQLVDQMGEKGGQTSWSNRKMVANFRKASIPSKEQEIVDEEISRILKEEFGEDE